jgi:alpha-glucosidase
VNLSTEPIRLPARDTALLASGPLDGGFLPPDTAIWLGR